MTFRRGRAYSRAGRVGEIRIDGDRVRAAVKGTRPRPYEVWVRREGNRFISQCNCPQWGGSRLHCKHVAALLCTLGRSGMIEPAVREGTDAAEPPRPSPAAWLLEDAPIQAPISVDYLVAFERGWLEVQQLASDHAHARHPPDRARLAPEDRRLHDLLLSLGLPSPPGFRVEIERAGDLLAALRGRPVFLDEHRQIPLVFSDDTLSLRVVTPAGPDGLGPFRFSAVLAARGDSRPVPLEKAELLGGVQSFAIVDDQAYALDSRLPIRTLRRLALHPEVECRADELSRAFGEWFPRLAASTGALVPTPAEVMPTRDGTPRLSLGCDGTLTSVEASLWAQYGSAPPVRVEPRTEGGSVAPTEVQVDEAGHPFLLERDPAAEAAAVRTLLATGLEFSDGRFRAVGDSALRFWSRDVQTLPAEWERLVPERYRGLRLRSEPIRPRLHVGASGVGWFDVDLRFSSEDLEIDPEALRACLASNERYLTLSDGSFAPADPEACRAALEVLEDLDGAKAGRGKLPNWMAGSLEALISAVGPGAKVEPEAAARLARLADPAAQDVPLPAGLNGQLRPYQLIGYGWLRSLRDLGGLGALLADEMGLGKTIQTLALLAAAKEESEQHEPALVIAPTSVIPNWVRECERFTPGLRVVAFSGTDRKLPAASKVDLVVTSYALLRRDAKLLAGRAWSTVILDEAQNIKNPASATARAARELQAGFRIALTGTPVENRPLDLWSIFAFLTPSLLGKQEEFRRRYENGVGEEIARAHRRLAARVRPFLRRRLKHDVLVELPDKLETEVICELTPLQRSLYKQLLTEVRSQIFETIERQGVERAQVSILAGLLRLRQVACDPRLLHLAREFHDHDSAKLLLWRELLDEALDGDHRVICFSQFVSMLTLMRQSLDRDGIEYAYLDGRTRDRQAVIDRFNQVDATAAKPAPRVMLISLRAGGTGINLASADTVMLYDPWWNPAVEDQAVDRVHRIGQSKEVSVYRLVARGTVEEKIFELKQRKRDLSGRLIGGEAGGAFTAADVEELLRLG